MVFVADTAEDDVEEELELPLDVEELAEPTRTVCVAEEIDVVPDPADVEFEKTDESDAKV